MTMSLARGLTTLNTSKRKKKKKKYTDNQMLKLRVNWKQHNKHMKQLGCHNNVMTFEEYIDYVNGNYKPKSKPTVIQTSWRQEGYTRKTQYVPSHNSEYSFAPATKKEAMKYTGERKLVGIATLHKSNMVPVFADDDDKNGSKQATEIAQMRRN